MALWADIFKLFTYAFTPDPLEKKIDRRSFPAAGVIQPDAIPDIRNADTYGGGGGGGFVRLRETQDFIDLSSTTNRQARYKEYTRLLTVAEIEMAMTVFADEACVAGNTLISTVFYGPVTIEWLAQNKTADRFPVYCYDFEKEDYTIGWAYDPRLVKKAPTVKVLLENGSYFVVTPDHRILSHDGQWVQAGKLKNGSEIMPFYRVKANQNLTRQKTNQFPRIRTKNGWVHERQFIDEWRTGKEIKKYKRVNQMARLVAGGLHTAQISQMTNCSWGSVEDWLNQEGFSQKEIRQLAKKPTKRRVIAVYPWHEMDVYDLSVEGHANFATDCTIMHNCQRDENGKVFKIEVDNEEVKKELEFLFFHRRMLNMDQRRMWGLAKRLFINGDHFWELVINPDNPKEGVYKLQDLPCESVYRIETTKGKLVEFQQGKEGPDYQSLQRAPVTQATDQELNQATAIRFAPEQIVHMRIGDDRKTFYPYGISLIEPARGPAHSLKMMEDAMVVYRLCLVGNTRLRTAEGWKYIKDAKKGDVVFTLDRDSGEIVRSNVIWWVNNGKQKVYKVKSKHIAITGNETHPVLVNRQGVVQFVDIKDLQPKKDQLLNIPRDEEIPIEMPLLQEEQWGKLSKDCRKGLKTYFQRELVQHKSRINYWQWQEFALAGNATYPASEARKMCDTLGLKEDNLIIESLGNAPSYRYHLPRLVTEEFAQLFGFLLGDGHLRSTNYNSCSQVGFTCGTDRVQNAYYARLLKKFFGKIRFSKESRSNCPGKFEVDSKCACYLLLRMGYIPGAKNKRIPAWAFMASKSIRQALVRGLADADGSIRHLKTGLWTAEFALCNLPLIEDIKELWHSSGLSSGHIRQRERRDSHIIDHRTGRTMKGGTISYEVYISELPLPKFETILDVTYAGEEEIYDVTVDNDSHNIVVNGSLTFQTRAPERRVFYIDVATLPPFKVEAFMERLKDQFRKKKVVSNRTSQPGGAGPVEERWHAPAQDEDYWLPIRANSSTRIETLPGAQNLGEIDDAVYFRNKLFTALNFPKSYFSLEDPNATRITLSAQDVKFARLIERLQSYVEDGLWEVADRHLRLRGFPEESYEDLTLKMTPPSDWRELSRAEVITNRINNANSLMGGQMMALFDIHTKWMKYSENDANEMISRLKIQKLEDLKLQVLAQNPQLLGVGVPGQGEKEMGAEPGGPNPMVGPNPPAPPGSPPGGPPGSPAPPGGPPGLPPMPPPPEQPQDASAGMMPPAAQAQPLPDPSDVEITQYDLEIQSYDSDQDVEEPDYSDME